MVWMGPDQNGCFWIDILNKQAGEQNGFMKLEQGWNASVVWNENAGLGVLHDGDFLGEQKPSKVKQNEKAEMSLCRYIEQGFKNK